MNQIFMKKYIESSLVLTCLRIFYLWFRSGSKTAEQSGESENAMRQMSRFARRQRRPPTALVPSSTDCSTLLLMMRPALRRWPTVATPHLAIQTDGQWAQRASCRRRRLQLRQSPPSAGQDSTRAAWGRLRQCLAPQRPPRTAQMEAAVVRTPPVPVPAVPTRPFMLLRLPTITTITSNSNSSIDQHLMHC